MIDGFVGSHAVGIFSAAQELSRQSIQLLMASVILAGFPIAIQQVDQHGLPAARPQLTRNAKTLGFIGLPAAVGLAVLAGPISRVIFGHDFQDGIVLLIRIASLTAFLNGIRLFYFDQSFELAQRTKWLLLTAGTSMVINTVGDLILVPYFASAGAAVAALFGALVSLILSLAYARPGFRLPVPIGFWSICLLSSVVMALVILPLDADGITGLVVVIVAGGAVYLAVVGLLTVLLPALVIRQSRKQEAFNGGP